MKRFTFLLVCSFLAIVSFSQSNLTEGLVAYYPLNDFTSALDYSGLDNHGRAFGEAFVKDRFGMDKMAHYFSGNKSYIKVPDHPSLRLGAEGTIAFWAKAEEQGLPMAIVAKGNMFSAKGQYKYCSYGVGINKAHKIMVDSYTSKGQSIDRRNLIDTNPTDGEWHHFAMVFDRGELTYYKDGKKMQQTKTGHVELVQNDLPLYMGYEHVRHNTTYFKGALDDVFIYDRALKKSEIKAIKETKDFDTGKKPTLPEKVTYKQGQGKSPGETFIQEVREVETISKKNENSEPTPSKDKVYNKVDEMPRYYVKECEQLGTDEEKKNCAQMEMQFFFLKNFKIPNLVKLENKQVAVVQFVVETDGSLSNFRIVRNPVAGIGEEAVRVLGTMPKWLPGKIGGKLVRTWYSFPVTTRPD